MTVTDNKVSPLAGVGRKIRELGITSAISQTKTILDIVQLPYSFAVDAMSAYCSALAGTATADVRIVPVLPQGSVIDAVVLTIGGTATDFKINAAIRALLGQVVAPALVPALVYKAVTDNLPFSSAFTINVAGAAGLFWGAVRIQMDSAGAISTKVVAPDQAFATEAQALVSVPNVDNGKIDLGTITIQMKTTDTFTAQTTPLNDATTNAVHFNGRAASAFSCLTAEVAFVATEMVKAVPVTQISSRCSPTPGGLLLVDYTTNGTGVLTNGRVDVHYRPYPMAGETLVAGAVPAQ